MIWKNILEDKYREVTEEFLSHLRGPREPSCETMESHVPLLLVGNYSRYTHGKIWYGASVPEQVIRCVAKGVDIRVE